MPDNDPDFRNENVSSDRRPRRQRMPHDDWDDDRPRRSRERGDATGGLIPYKNPQALIGYYCGVFSLIPILGLILGPIAVVLGIMGLSFAKKHPTAGGTGHAIVALILGGLSTLGHFGCILFAMAGLMFG